MILPGHVGASLIASHYLGIDRRVAIIAALAPDVLDKFAFHILRATHWTRLPAHAPLALAGSTVVVALVGWLWRRDWRWGAAWLAGYSLHLLGDLIPPDGALPCLWPFYSYPEFVSSGRPWFLGGGPVPWVSLTIEVAVVIAAVVVELAHRRSRVTRP